MVVLLSSRIDGKVFEYIIIYARGSIKIIILEGVNVYYPRSRQVPSKEPSKL